jgi:phosphatidylinositol glycan class B
LEKKYFLIAAIIMVFASWNSVGFHQGDEHFQVWEFAGYKLGIIPVEDLAWEFGEQMRPAAQPALAYAGYQVFSLGKTIDPFWITFIFRVLSSAFFLVVTWLLWRRFAPALRAQKLKHWLLLVLLFHWCTLYSGVRFSSENWSGLLLAVAFLLYPLPQADEKHRFTPGGGKTTHWYNYILAGGLFGLAFLFRYQVALMVVGFGAWLIFIGKEHFTRLVLLVLGGCAAVALGTVLDYWLYGEWVLAPWNYLAVNLIEGKAATFGSEPWWWYFIGVLEKGVPPLSLIYLGAGLWFFYRYRKDPITWMAIPFLLVHFYLSRKDVRFLYPLLPYLGLMIMAAVQAIQDTRGKRLVWAAMGQELHWATGGHQPFSARLQRHPSQPISGGGGEVHLPRISGGHHPVFRRAPTLQLRGAQPGFLPTARQHHRGENGAKRLARLSDQHLSVWHPDQKTQPSCRGSAGVYQPSQLDRNCRA